MQKITLDELNDIIRAGSIDELVHVSEARQVKALSQIADQACARPNVRLLLLAGASSAGKTTTSLRLCTQLAVNDRTALHLSTDDYFVGDAHNPRDEHGKLDYEHVDCVDVPALVSDIKKLLAGDEIPLRRFDFPKHKPKYVKGKFLQLPDDGMIVLEGLHALNPKLSEGLADDVKFRIAIDPQPEAVLTGEDVPTSADARFLRRMVRDNHYRKMDPTRTVEMWPNVMAGEQKWIAPFRSLADVTFNSYLVYELAVLRPFAGGLLERARLQMGDVPLITAAYQRLMRVLPISSEWVAGDSILRETIGGSVLEY